MVDDFDLEPEIGIFVLQCVEAMRARRDHRPRAAMTLVDVDGRGVTFRKHRKEKLVARAPGGIPRAILFGA